MLPASVKLSNDDDGGSISKAAEDITKAFTEMIKDPEGLDKAANYLYNELLDDVIFGILLDVYHLHATGNLDAVEGDADAADSDSESSFRIVDKPGCDIFGMPTILKPIDVACPNCNRSVSVLRFAKHLAKCMGMDRKSRSSKRLGTKEGASSSSSSYIQFSQNDGSDDEDDAEEKRRRKPQSSRNGGFKKKNGKST